MIKLSTQKLASIAKNPGRRPKRPEMTPAQIKSEAIRLMSLGMSSEVWRVLEWLAEGGVMSVQQLGLNPRTLRKYATDMLVDRVPYPTRDIITAFENQKIPIDDDTMKYYLYVLGPVGLEIIKGRHKLPMTGYLSYPLARTMHDVILNEIVFRFVGYAESLGWEATWFGTNSAMIFDWEKNQEVLEPDALVILKREGKEIAFCLEYHHNEDKKTRAEDKVKKYQSGYESQLWEKGWELETFPTVLAVFDRSIVGQGYQKALLERKMDVTFYGKALSSVWQGNVDIWVDFLTNARIPLLQEGGGNFSPAR